MRWVPPRVGELELDGSASGLQKNCLYDGRGGSWEAVSSIRQFPILIFTPLTLGLTTF
jgi:hypothetical protein